MITVNFLFKLEGVATLLVRDSYLTTNILLNMS